MPFRSVFSAPDLTFGSQDEHRIEDVLEEETSLISTGLSQIRPKDCRVLYTSSIRFVGINYLAYLFPSALILNLVAEFICPNKCTLSVL